MAATGRPLTTTVIRIEVLQGCPQSGVCHQSLAATERPLTATVIRIEVLQDASSWGRDGKALRFEGGVLWAAACSAEYEMGEARSGGSNAQVGGVRWQGV